jgi:hypothetical protein
MIETTTVLGQSQIQKGHFAPFKHDHVAGQWGQEKAVSEIKW